METVKIGTVESVTGRRCKVRMPGTYTVLAEMTVLRTVENGNGPWIPSIGDRVVCLMIQNGAGQGFVIGAI